MTIEKKMTGTHMDVMLEGRLDTVTAPALESEMKTAVDEAEDMTLDLKKLEYISSAGLRVLLFIHKVMSEKGGLKIINVNEIVMEVLDVTGFSDVLNIVE